jgi:putative nucleotidyltransferase with HDIG domain
MKKVRACKLSAVQICSVIVAGIVICMVSLAVSAEVKSKKIVHYEQDTVPVRGISSIPYITYSISKSWTEADGSTGAEYDGVFRNNSKHALTDWRIKISVPEKSRIDSSWNGQYTKESNFITVLPPVEGFNASVPSGQKITFGMVMYTPEKFTITKTSFSGRFIYSSSDTILFRILLAACIIVCFPIIFLSVTGTIRQRRINREIEQSRKRNEENSIIIDQALRTIANFVDVRDKNTKGHSVRVALYSREIARRLGFPAQKQHEMYYLGLMHDAGKIGIPDEILNKTAPLTQEERKIIEKHTQLGANMLKDFTSMPGIRDIALYHHERYDGTGYPDHLSGAAIPLAARIVCVADSFDAMTSDRCYHGKSTVEQAEAELIGNSGIQFDPEIVAIMVKMIHDGFAEKIISGEKND